MWYLLLLRMRLMMVRVQLVLLAWAVALPLIWCITYRNFRQYFYEQHHKPMNIHGRDIPVLKMLKRQVRHFREGQRASITLVFRSTKPVSVRWFKDAPNSKMVHSEVENMLPMEGDPCYTISFISSGDVTATTMMITEFTEDFARKFETVISSLDGTMQYQIRTIIESPTDYQLDTIDSPEWMTVPSQKLSYTPGRQLRIHCKVFVPNEMTGRTNELLMSRIIIAKEPSKFKMDFKSIIVIHRETQNFAEENGNFTIMKGLRRPLKHGHVIYEVNLHTTNATRFYEGIYMCHLERKYDKVFISSLITPEGVKSPYPKLPIVDLISCEQKNYNPREKYVTFTEGRETCLRCRGAGSPQPSVALYDRYGREIQPSSEISVSKYINVADAGVSEATYTFHYPTPDHAGNYHCKAYNGEGSATLSFRILV